MTWHSLSTLCALLSVTSLSAAADTAATAEVYHLATNDSLLWGPYRPNVYFGVRPRLPDSFTAGLMWSKLTDFTSLQTGFRHTCEQNEGMQGYGWEEYDVRNGGRQVIHDSENFLDVTTEFVKFPGGERGGSWGVRVKGQMREDAVPNMPSTAVFYVGLEGEGTMEIENKWEELGYAGDVNFKGSTPALGDFKMTITKGPSNEHPESSHGSRADRDLTRTMVQALRAPSHLIWQTKALLFNTIKAYIDPIIENSGQEALPPPWQSFTIGNGEEDQEGNLFLVQKVFQNNFEFDVIFSSASAKKDITSKDLTKGIKENSEKFKADHKKIFQASNPFDIHKYDAFSKSLFSNLVGGIGYFQGGQLVDRSYDEAYQEDDEGFWEEAAEARKTNQPTLEGPYELFTAVPSRPFFPRGFLWDEGFHLLPILDWDRGLTLEIIKSWFATVDKDGWIPREQILGQEARSKVPAEFATQYPHYANPPTLFMAVEEFAKQLNSKDITSEQKTEYTDALQRFYPLFKVNYNWYRKTQQGDFKTWDREAFSQKEGYRWRGRTPQHILTSGLDDYPRAQPPTTGELHVDLLSWMGMMTRSLKSVAEILGAEDDIADLNKIEEAVTRNLDDLHWSDKHQTYCDSTVDVYDEISLVCHKGYISIFPFMTGMLSPDHAHLGAVLDLIADPDELWSDHGIRSLSKKDPLYGQDENYWRSPIWINMNYLILDNLRKVATVSGPQQQKAADIYERLRRNIVETVYQSWKETGFAWEQYNPETGQGQRTQHFTGWTSLVVKVMTMPDLSGERTKRPPRSPDDHSYDHSHGHGHGHSHEDVHEEL